MHAKTIIVHQPHWIEMGMIFAAGYCVGKYFRQEVPTTAERYRGNVVTTDENGTPIINSSITGEVVQEKRKPLVEYDPVDGKVSFNLRRK